ncbi:uncharacterized protein [Rutidosis leptorrhynchoides]|uniref:uncharacterized protein n=1 Tax=Rutidosis leptorrhynchoides TaxID=125765 RepID=UPI003A9956CC
MAEMANIGGSQVVDETSYVFLDQLEEGKQATFRGNVIQIAAKNNIAHYFIHRLKEGVVYFLSDFDVVPNKPDYRLLNDNQVMIQLQGSTRLRKQATNDTTGFICHPFNCVTFEALTPTNGKYLVGTLTVSSTSSTLVVEDPTIPTLAEFINKLRGKDLCGNLEYYAIEILASVQTEGTLVYLLKSSRKGKGSGSSTTKVEIFKCTVHVANVRTNNGWYYVSCNICQAKKGITRQDGHYWCESCAKDVLTDHHVVTLSTRFQIQLEVTDGTSESVVVLFDETANKLVKATAKSLVAELDEDSPSHVLPNPIVNLINTTHTLLLKAGTHYEHGSHESFNCLRVLNSTPNASMLPVTGNKAQPPIVDPSVSTPAGKK